MRISLFTFVGVITLIFVPLGVHLPTEVNAVQQASRTVTLSAAAEEEGIESASRFPVRVTIPSISLDSPIEYVGTNDKGEMAVPNGASDHVGWYRFGTIPGEEGSAVLAAHVYAAFSSLKDVERGADIYVETTGEPLHFVVDDIRDYRLSDLAPQTLFGSRGDRRLNLITCAGNFRTNIGTYDRRIIVSARLVEPSRT